MGFDFEFNVLESPPDKGGTLKYLIQYVLHRTAEWQEYVDRRGIKTEQEVSEIDYVASFSSQEELKLRRGSMRFVAIRKLKDGQLELGEHPYSYQVIVTNTEEKDLNKIFQTHWGRCGTVEKSYRELKSGCGVRRLPSRDFRVNASWFSLGIMAHNVIKFLQKYVMPKKLKRVEIRTLTHRFFRTAAMVVNRSHDTIIRFCRGDRLFFQFKEATENLLKLHYRLTHLE